MTDLNALAVFVAIADAGNFRAASDRLGVTRSAVSQTIGRLETKLGIALFHRTTRSMRLTEAGEHLYASVAPAIAEVSTAVETATRSTGGPTGQLRLAISSIAESFISGPLLSSFSQRYPDIQLDVLVTDDEFDIVAAGYDAAVRLGEVVEQDMIAVPVSDMQQQLAVCAPSYLQREGSPSHPRELVAHRCVGWRPKPANAPYRWEFGEGDTEYAVEVAPEITTNDMWLMIRLACAGAGITFGMADTFRPWIERGDLVPILEPYCPTFSGFFLYFPSRRNLAPKLRALIDFIRDYRNSDNTSQ